jgi:hypothetical protein
MGTKLGFGESKQHELNKQKIQSVAYFYDMAIVM